MRDASKMILNSIKVKLKVINDANLSEAELANQLIENMILSSFDAVF